MGVSRYRGKGEKIDSLITLAGYRTINSTAIKPDSVMRVELTISCRQTDGAHRAMFKRTGLFFRMSNGPVQIQGSTWITDQTIRSDSAIDVIFSLGGASVDFKVKNAGNVSTRWVGEVIKTEIS